MESTNKLKKILYLSYDGLTDPLGQSQILPYLEDLAQQYYSITILSFEKPKRFKQLKNKIEELCINKEIKWVPLVYTSKPPILSKLYDLYKFKRKAISLNKANKYNLIHARSYVSADVALKLKLKHGTPWIFDMRGFWVDERVEGRIWNLKNPLYRYIYRQYRRKELSFITNSDRIVTLTHAAKAELSSGSFYSFSQSELLKIDEKTAVIPCAADQKLFSFITNEQKFAAKKELNLVENKVLLYMGSFGTWYLQKEMLLCFRLLLERHPSFIFKILTPEPKESIINEAKNLNIPIEKLQIEYVERENLKTHLFTADLGICFMKPGFSRKATSPVKFAEMQSLGIPCIVNSGIGDMDAQIAKFNGGYVLKDTSFASFQHLINEIDQLLTLDRNHISKQASAVFSLGLAKRDYGVVYRAILQRQSQTI